MPDDGDHAVRIDGNDEKKRPCETKSLAQGNPRRTYCIDQRVIFPIRSMVSHHGKNTMEFSDVTLEVWEMSSTDSSKQIFHDIVIDMPTTSIPRYR